MCPIPFHDRDIIDDAALLLFFKHILFIITKHLHKTYFLLKTYRIYDMEAEIGSDEAEMFV